MDFGSSLFCEAAPAATTAVVFTPPVVVVVVVVVTTVVGTACSVLVWTWSVCVWSWVNVTWVSLSVRVTLCAVVRVGGVVVDWVVAGPVVSGSVVAGLVRVVAGRVGVVRVIVALVRVLVPPPAPWPQPARPTTETTATPDATSLRNGHMVAAALAEPIARIERSKRVRRGFIRPA